ncbi:MAG: acyltransferase [Rhodospirillales bacterium]|nr:acyltransferase [Rhodospirillales bacterium]
MSVVNGLRGVAILGVLFQHVVWGWISHHSGGVPDGLLALVSNGWTGVNLFFILSGFVLFLPYAAGLRSMLTWKDATRFYWHRLFRLMPLYYFAVLLILAIGAAGMSQAGFVEAAQQLLLLRFVVSRYGFMPPIDYPLWSIGVEILFSVAFPVMVVLVARLGLVRILALALSAALIARIFGRIWNPGPLGPNFISDNLPGRIDEFVLGMAIAELYARERVPIWAPRLIGPGLFLIALSWEAFFQCQYRGLSTVMMSPANNLLDAGLCCVLLGALAREGSGRSVLAFAPLQVIGMMCYSIYIWHAPVMSAVVPIAGDVPALLLTLAVAAFTYRYIEFRKEPDWRTLFLANGIGWRRRAATEAPVATCASHGH